MIITPTRRGLDHASVTSIAAGSTLGLEQQLLANAGQVARNVLIAGPTTNGKFQGCSLGGQNVIQVYETGADFQAGNVWHREFMRFGEPICFDGIPQGALLTSTAGWFGMTEIEGPSLAAGNQGVMPAGSYGLSFRDTFFHAFRNSTGNNNDRGVVFVSNGPLASVINLTTGTGDVVRGQATMELGPWEATYLDLDGNGEYRLFGTEPMTAWIISRGGGTAVDGPVRPESGLANLSNGQIWDAKQILPLTSDGIVQPRSGFMSAPFNNTAVSWYDRQGDQGVLGTGSGVSPGSPQDIDTSVANGGTANNQGDHNPAGYTRFLATGLVTAHSGADGQGGDAVPMYPVSAMSQVIAQPFRILDQGAGDEAGITAFGPMRGTAQVLSWNGDGLTLEYTLPVTRDGGITISSKEDQLHPCAVQLSNSNVTNRVPLVGDLNPGVIIADVPIGAVIQSRGDSSYQLRTQGGGTTTGIYTQEDETVMFGWTPPELAAEVIEGADGIQYRRFVDGGVQTWEQT
ncbi:MAG: hypothetical protein AAGA37_19720 [Actinomycetota bacterium]